MFVIKYLNNILIAIGYNFGLFTKKLSELNIKLTNKINFIEAIIIHSITTLCFYLTQFQINLSKTNRCLPNKC